MNPAFGVVAVIVAILFVVYVERNIKKGTIKPRTSYSYKKVVISTGKMMLVVFVLSVALYFWTKSFESSFGVFIFLSSCLFLNMIRQLLNEYHVKRRIEG